MSALNHPLWPTGLTPSKTYNIGLREPTANERIRLVPTAPKEKSKDDDKAVRQATYNVEAAVRALRIFEVFAFEGRPLSLAELTRCLDIPSSSCLLLIRTLRRRGYLYETSNRTGYYPTRRMLDHAVNIASHETIVERLTPTLAALRDRTEATIALSKLQGDHAIFLVVFNSPHTQRVRVTAGTLRPLHATATGKALIACMEPEDRQELLDRLTFTRFTPRTVIERPAFEAELQRMSERGWFSSERETLPDLASVSVPLQMGAESYAITISEPAYLMEKHLQDHVQALTQLATELRSEHAAYTPARTKKRPATKRAAR